MAAFLIVIAIFVCLLGSGNSYQETRKSRRILTLNEKPCLDQGACATSEESTRISKSRKCRSDSDCIGNEYCHTFHRLCVKPVEVVTPVKTSVKRCSKDSDCRTAEYCHVFWRICLPSRRVHYRKPPTRRPSWYCYTSKDCKINEQCHGRFHSCYTRPGISTVRRNAGNSRRCETTSDCGENFYCHVHFRICLENVPTANKPSSKIRKQKTCSSKTPCPKGMLCHHFWSICYIPARVVTLPKRNKTEQCQIDSDCRPNEFCHFMVTSAGHLVARQRRSIQRICLPRRFQKIKKNKEVGTCKTAADCGPSRCCLKKLGVCMGYKLPGEMCLTEEADFACPCAGGSTCKTRGKWASPRRIINKMKLPQTAAYHLLRGMNKRKHQVGKCTRSPL